MTTFICCGWAYGCTTLTLFIYMDVDVGAEFFENWGKLDPKWCCGVMVEAVYLCSLHPTFILNIYEVFEHLHMLWISICWVHNP
jgi:hypothetical protein